MNRSFVNVVSCARWCALACFLAAGHGVVGSDAAQSTSPQPGAELFTSGVIRRIQIELQPDALASLRNDSREFASGMVSEGGSNYSQVAIRLKGATGSFRSLDEKPALTLDFCRFAPGRKFHGLRRIHLNNSVEDPSYTNEKLGSELFQAAGIPAPRVTRALVELNGRALGLYVLKEGFTEDFLSLHFKRVSGELYEPEDGHDVNEKLDRNSVEARFDKERIALKSLASAAAETDSTQRWRKLKETLNTKEFLTFMALEIMLGHRDGYCIARNNFRVYHDVDGGRMVFFPQGMDQLFGTADLPWKPHLAGVVARAVMDTSEGQQAYDAIFTSLLASVFKVEALTNRVEQLVLELRPVLGRKEFAIVKAEGELLKERIVKRKQSLSAQLNQPALKPMEFTSGVARPTEWTIAEPPRKGKMDRTNVDGLAALHISTSSEVSASWRAKILVPRGKYRFEGRARIAGVEPLPFGTHHGAGLRIGGEVRETASFTGDSSWQTLGTGFAVEQAMKEVELICELRARSGEAWFDLNSLRVMKLDDL